MSDVVLTSRLAGPEGEQRLLGVCLPHASPNLDVGGVVVLANLAVFTPPGALWGEKEKWGGVRKRKEGKG